MSHCVHVTWAGLILVAILAFSASATAGLPKEVRE